MSEQQQGTASLNLPSESRQNLTNEHEDRPPTLLDRFKKLRQTCLDIEKNSYFEMVITGCIFIAAVSSGLQTYDEFTEKNKQAIDRIDDIVLYIFTLEVVIKLTGNGYKYFLEPWNVFDFTIVVMGFVFNLFLNFSAVGVIRIIRLLRVLKLVKAFPELRVLVGALLKSIPSMFYVLCLLMLLFYLFAVTAVTFFKDNDPEHFANLQLAMLTLWRISTFEDWTDIMYINMYGCDVYGYSPDSVYKCTDPSSGGVFAALFFCSFTVLSTMLILNLFVGVILTGVEEAQAAVDEEDCETAEQTEMTTDEMIELVKLIEETSLPAILSLNEQLTKAVQELRDEDEKRPQRRIEQLASLSKTIEEHPKFDFLITACIFIAAISSGIQTYDSFVDKHGAILDGVDTAILYVFALEAIIKLVARYPQPLTYFVDPWNVFDFVIVVMGFVFNYFLNFSAVGVIRIIRLLRVLKLVKAFPELRVLVSALLKSIPSMFYVLCLLMLLFYLYAVTCVTFYRDNDPFHFGNLHLAMLSLWRISTFEDWTDIMYINMYGCNVYGYFGDDPAPVYPCNPGDSNAFGLWSPLLFVSFTFLATLIVLNLFVGVILNGVDEAQAEESEEQHDTLLRVTKQVSKIESKLPRLAELGIVPFKDTDAGPSGSYGDNNLL